MQVVDRTMGDLARVAKAQLKEFLSAVNACVKEDVVDALDAWAGNLVADIELRELAHETGSRQMHREQLKRQLVTAAQNERDLAGLGLGGETMLVADAAADGADDGAAAASAAPSAARVAAEKLSAFQARQPAAAEAARNTEQMKTLLTVALNESLESSASGVVIETRVDKLQEDMRLRDDEQAAFMAALRAVCSALPADGDVRVGGHYLMTTAEGDLCIGMYKAEAVMVRF
jgi:hypothetical protein